MGTVSLGGSSLALLVALVPAVNLFLLLRYGETALGLSLFGLPALVISLPAILLFGYQTAGLVLSLALCAASKAGWVGSPGEERLERLRAEIEEACGATVVDAAPCDAGLVRIPPGSAGEARQVQVRLVRLHFLLQPPACPRLFRPLVGSIFGAYVPALLEPGSPSELYAYYRQLRALFPIAVLDSHDLWPAAAFASFFLPAGIAVPVLAAGLVCGLHALFLDPRRWTFAAIGVLYVGLSLAIVSEAPLTPVENEARLLAFGLWTVLAACAFGATARSFAAEARGPGRVRFLAKALAAYAGVATVFTAADLWGPRLYQSRDGGLALRTPARAGAVETAGVPMLGPEDREVCAKLLVVYRSRLKQAMDLDARFRGFPTSQDLHVSDPGVRAAQREVFGRLDARFLLEVREGAVTDGRGERYEIPDAGGIHRALDAFVRATEDPSFVFYHKTIFEETATGGDGVGYHVAYAFRHALVHLTLRGSLQTSALYELLCDVSRKPEQHRISVYAIPITSEQGERLYQELNQALDRVFLGGLRGVFGFNEPPDSRSCVEFALEPLLQGRLGISVLLPFEMTFQRWFIGPHTAFVPSAQQASRLRLKIGPEERPLRRVLVATEAGPRWRQHIRESFEVAVKFFLVTKILLVLFRLLRPGVGSLAPPSRGVAGARTS